MEGRKVRGRGRGRFAIPKWAPLNPKAEELPPLELEGGNPLLNPLILRTVFSFLKEADLLSCRLVHSTWNQEAIPYLKECCTTIIIEEDSRVSTYALVNCIHSSDDFPFTKFRLCQSPNLMGSGQEWNALMEAIALVARELNLWCKTTFPSFTLPEGIQFPELRCLHTLYSDDLDPHFIPKLIDTAPKLRSLSLNDLQITQLEALTSKENLKLDTLALLFYNNPKGEKHFLALYNLLRSQRENVEMLEVTKCNRAPKHNRRLLLDSSPLSFPKVKTLILHNVEESFLGDLFGGEKGMHFAARFPVLNSLTVELWDLNDDRLECFLPGPPVTSVQELKMHSYRDVAGHPLVQENVTRLFPKLTSLKICVESEIVWRLVEELECLQKLVLYCRLTTSEVDQIFTGLSAEECNLMSGLTRQQFQEKWGNLDRGNPLESSPRSALHRIQVLFVGFGDSSLSDASCRLVFLQMRNLKILKLYGEHQDSFAQISASVKKEMEEKFQHVINIQE